MRSGQNGRRLSLDEGIPVDRARMALAEDRLGPASTGRPMARQDPDIAEVTGAEPQAAGRSAKRPKSRLIVQTPRPGMRW